MATPPLSTLRRLLANAAVLSVSNATIARTMTFFIGPPARYSNRQMTVQCVRVIRRWKVTQELELWDRLTNGGCSGPQVRQFEESKQWLFQRCCFLRRRRVDLLDRHLRRAHAESPPHSMPEQSILEE